MTNEEILKAIEKLVSDAKKTSNYTELIDYGKFIDPNGTVKDTKGITPIKQSSLEQRVAQLEKRVAKLEARPYYPVLQPLMPSPIYPPNYPWITYTQVGSSFADRIPVYNAVEKHFQ